MKTTFKNAIKATVIAAALACAGLAHADDTYNQSPTDGGAVFDSKAKFFKPLDQFGAVTASQYEMTSNSDFSKQFFVYCIAPSFDTYNTAVYSAHANASVSDAVKILFETAYQGTLGKDKGNEQLAFQLALWELHNDDGNLYTGHMAFSHDAADQLEAAQALLDSVGTHSLQNLYHYTTFTGVTPEGVVSQEMLGVSPVPEVEAWAMLLVGLGLIGFVRRRQNDIVDEEKFA